MSLDSTVGGADANSYVSVSEADTYFGARIASSAWTALTEANKEAYLITSTMMLEAYVNWKGDKSSSTQALHWPAENATDCNGDAIPDDSIPEKVKMAVYEQAYYLLSINAINDPVAIMKGIKSATVGPIEVVFDKLAIPDRIGPYVAALIRCYGSLIGGARKNGISMVGVLRA